MNAHKMYCFNEYKGDIVKKIELLVAKELAGRQFDQKDAQQLSNTLCDEIIDYLHDANLGFKYIANVTLFQKGDASLHFSSTCLWNPNTDGSITVKYENDQLHCFVCLFGVAP